MRPTARLLVFVTPLALMLSGPAVFAGVGAGEPGGITPSELFPGAVFDPAIPTQEASTGVRSGARPLRHAELMRYLEALDDASPRARLTRYAETHEGRPMVVFAVGDEATIARLDEFREEHARRVDPRGRAAGEDGAALQDAKAVAWLAYGIHGDELSSSDAAAALAYRLVAGEDEASRALRRDLLILIDPCENPDGRERFLAQTSSFAHAVPNPDTEDLSHSTVWPWGRGNHYLFDLNRDWFSLVHPESARSGVIASWNPQLVVDSHEMGSHDTYLFSPSRHPFNPYKPAALAGWAQRFAGDQAAALDRHGYGSSWGSYLGAVGILYEMSSTAGTLVNQRTGTVRTFAEAVEHQATSSMANLGTLADNREAILDDYVTGRRVAIGKAGTEWPAAWVLPRASHSDRTDKLAELLRRQGIEALRNDGPIQPLTGLRDARTGATVPAADLPDTAYVVPLDQPAGRLVRQLLDPHIPMNAEFFREEREYLERGKGTRLYETTAWSLPLSYDIEAWWTLDKPSGSWTAEPFPLDGGAFGSLDHPYGYLLDGGPDRAMPALADLMQQGVAVRVAQKPFRVDGHDWGRGSLLIKREGNPDDLSQRLLAVAQRWDVTIAAVPTAKSEEGPDLGGKRFHHLLSLIHI